MKRDAANINQSVDVLPKTSHLFDPFPEVMAYRANENTCGMRNAV